MDKHLKVYTGEIRDDIPFPNADNQLEIVDFSYDIKRMGGAPIVSASVKYPICLDDLWTGKEHVYLNGHYFTIKQTPSSSYSNEDNMYKHDVVFVSQRIILDNIYFYDVVTDPKDVDRYVSNSSKVTFFGDIHEFAERLNHSLEYSKAGYFVRVDEGISTEGFTMSFEDQFFSQVLQTMFEVYGVPYYFHGLVIRIGYTYNVITRTFKYGVDDSLLSISKTNANYKIVNRITGTGSSDNIPYYYPNPSDDRSAIEAEGGKWITPSDKLMLPIYRESLGADRFYNAKNETYRDPITGEYYIFENECVEMGQKEHKVSFDHIKPTIKEMVNAAGLRIDMFEAFDYDTNDNDETDAEGNYIHPYFFGKLRKFDGVNGFNLFAHAIEEDEMTISMTSGSCGACNFVIGVDDDTQKNPVQVHTNGELLRDKDGNVIRSGKPQDIQQNTQTNSVWIALRKDTNTFGAIMPNATNNYKPNAATDTFVILHIDLPQAYITSAENKLKEEVIKYMATNNSDKFNFSINFSRIFLAENPEIFSQINENARVQIEYNKKLYELYISSYSYKMSSNEALPQITVELSDTLTINKGTLQTSIDSVKQDIMNSVGGNVDILKLGLRYFIRKDVKDYARFVSFRDGIDVGGFESLISGGTFRKDVDGKSYIEVDRLYVRLKAIFENLEIKKTTYVGGEQISSPAAMKCIKVQDREVVTDPDTGEVIEENIWGYYRCFYLNEQEGKRIENEFRVGDQAISKETNLSSGSSVSNQYYWRLVVGVGDGYIDLSKTDFDAGSTDPLAGDDIVQLGNRTDKTRQKAIIQSTVSADAPSIKFLYGIDSYSLEGKAIMSQGFDSLTNRAFLKVYGETYIGKQDESSYIKYTPENGVEIKAKLTTLGGKDVDDEFNTLKDLIDGNIQTWFEDPAPTLTNYPANTWLTDKEKDNHLGDLYYSAEGKAYRFQKSGAAYEWILIQDTDITTALAEAKKAQEAANKAQQSADEAKKNVSDLNTYIDGAFSDGIITEAEAIAIEKYKNSVNETIRNIEASYIALYSNSYLTGAPKTELKSAFDSLKSSVNNLLQKIETAISDGKTTVQEKNEVDIAYATFNDKIAIYSTAVENANKSIQDSLKSLIDATNKELAGYKYIKDALDERTSIEGGLILSSLLSLGQTVNGAFTVRSGLNGVYKDTMPGDGIAFWAGGPMKDLAEDFPLPWSKTPKPTDPSKYATSVIRMDGTVYHADGNFWIDELGKIHCDPLSFFVGEDQVGDILTLFTPVVTGTNKDVVGIRQNFPFEDGTGKGLLKIGSFTLMEDSDGNLKLVKNDGSFANLAITGGFAQYATTTFSGNILDALPIDGTLSKEGGVLSVVGGGGGSNLLSKLGDTMISSPLNNQVLTYDSVLGKWVNSVGGLDTNAIWNELAKVDATKKIDLSHIPDLGGKYVTLDTNQTITGVKTYRSSQYLKGDCSIFITPVNSSNATGMFWTKQNSTEIMAGIGNHTNGDRLINMYIGWGNRPYEGINNFSVNSTSLYYKNNELLHTGNYSPTLDTRYVKKTGDTMSGSYIINKNIISGFSSFIEGYNNQLVSGNVLILKVGHSDTSKNNAYFGFGYYGNADSRNYLTLGLRHVDKVLNITAIGYTGIGTIAPDEKLDVVGNIRGHRFKSLSSTGTSPIQVNSTTLCANLNADMLDGFHAVGTSGAAIIRRGYTIANTTPTWCRLAKYNMPNTEVRTDVAFMLHSAYSNMWGILVIRSRGGEYVQAQIMVSYGIDISKIRIYHDSGKKNVELYYLAGESYSVMIAELLYSTHRVGSFDTSIDMYDYNTAAPSYTSYINPERATLQNNVASATKLQTARTINGTSFDGTANIVTSYWGTARTLSAGTDCSGSVSVNGSGNFTLPITVNTATKLRTARTINGTSFNGTSNIVTSYWGNTRTFYINDPTGSNYNSYSVNGSGNTDMYLPSTMQGFSSITSTNFVGNASTATRLQNSRSIWGQSFNGSSNVSGSLTGVADITMSGRINNCQQVGHNGSGLMLGNSANNGWVSVQDMKSADSNWYIYQNGQAEFKEVVSKGAVTGYYSASDMRLKNLISAEYDAMGIINTLDTFKFKWNSTAKSLKAPAFEDEYEHFGISAQQLERVSKTFIANTKINGEYLILRKEELVPLLVQAMKQLSRRIDKIESKINN